MADATGQQSVLDLAKQIEAMRTQQTKQSEKQKERTDTLEAAIKASEEAMSEKQANLKSDLERTLIKYLSGGPSHPQTHVHIVSPSASAAVTS